MYIKKSYKSIVISLFILLVTVGCSPEYINTEDKIVDIHEKNIKDMFINFGYTEDEVKDIEIVYIGDVNEYLFYKVNEITQTDDIGFVAGSDEISFPPGTNKSYFVFDKENNLHYPLQGLLNNPKLSNYIQEVSNLINDDNTKQTIEVYNLIGSDSKLLLFSDKDIKSYEWNEQKVYFNDNIQIPDDIRGSFKDPYIGSEIFNTSNHDKFQLYVNKELIYEGYYTQSVASSFIGIGMTMVDELGGVSFEYGGIIGGEDYRFDQRIYDALEVNELLGD